MQSQQLKQFRNLQSSTSVPSSSPLHSNNASCPFDFQSRGMAALNDYEVENHLLSAIDLDYPMLDNELKRVSANNTINISDQIIPLQRHIPSTTYAINYSPQNETAPLLDSEFYFGDILGDNGVPPQGLHEMAKSNEIGEHDPIIPENHANNLFSSDTAITNEELSHHSSKVDNNFSPEFSSVPGNARFGPKPGLDHDVEDEPLSRRATTSLAKACHFNDEGHAYINSVQDLFSQSKNQVDILQTDSIFDEAGKHNEGTVDENKPSGLMSNSPVSGISMTNGQLTEAKVVGTHPDLYENLPLKIQKHVDHLREKIAVMPRRKLRESLAQSVTLQDVEPLMFINRDELAGMLGVGVTTWKTFMHSLGVPRWPARMLKSQRVKEDKLVEKKQDAEKCGDQDLVQKLDRDLEKLKFLNSRRRKQLRTNAELRVANVTIKKK